MAGFRKVVGFDDEEKIESSGKVHSTVVTKPSERPVSPSTASGSRKKGFSPMIIRDEPEKPKRESSFDSKSYRESSVTTTDSRRGMNHTVRLEPSVDFGGMSAFKSARAAGTTRFIQTTNAPKPIRNPIAKQFCKYCGTPMPLGSMTCSKCGRAGRMATSKNRAISTGRTTVPVSPAKFPIKDARSLPGTSKSPLSSKLKGKWMHYKLQRKTRVKIGQSEECDITVSDMRMQACHANLIKQGRNWVLYDNTRTNSIFINRKKMRAPTPLQMDDYIQIFDTCFVFMGTELAYLHQQKSTQTLQIDIERKRIHRKTLIENIHIQIPSGEFVLVLDGSGVGKTTFMNAVLGTRKAKGKILLNGLDLYAHFHEMKQKIGYVPQFSLVRENETVENALIDAAKLKLPPDVTEEALTKRVNEVLAMLALESHRNKLFSNLSGGKKKRVSVAMEAVSDPSLFFLDEPDSGLDGGNGRNLMEILHGIALQDKIVMTITYAPNNAQDLFTKVIVLAKSEKDGIGRLVFYGTVDEALEFFEVETLQEIILRINPVDEGGEARADEYIMRYELWKKGKEEHYA